MAGFLRKKTKQPEPTTKGLPTVSLSSSGPPPPLFSRFATNGQNSSNVSPRIVSSPMSLASHGRKDLTPKGGVGRGNNNFGASSLAAGSREAEMARRRAQEQAQASQASLNHHSTRPIVDKPLPSPVGNDGPSQPLPTASPAVGRRTISNRGPGPPPTFQTQQHQGMWSRASLDSRDRDTKPLPRPGSAQASYASQERQAPPASYTLTPAVPPKPKVSVSSFNTAVTPQIGPPITNAYRKTQPPLPPSSGQSSDEGFASQAPLPQTSKRTQDFPSDALNGVGGAQSNLRLSQQTLPEIYSTPMSVRALDLPPEFALFQEYSDAISDTGAPDSSNTNPPPSSSLKVTDLVPGSSIARSGPENQRGLQRQPSIPQLGASNSSNVNAQPSPSPPSPPPPADMGITTSHVIGSDLLPSSYKADFHAPRVLTSNARSPTYNNSSGISSNDVNYQPQPSRLPVLANSRSTSPPLPPGAALPSNFHPFHVRNAQDGGFPSHFAHSSPLPPPPPAKRQSQSFQQQFYPSSVLQQTQNAPPHVQPPQPMPVPVAALSVRKSSSVRTATTPLKGKPRIFAAMEAQESETEQPAPQPSPAPPSLPSQFPEQPPHHHVLTKPHHEVTPSPQIQHHHIKHPHPYPEPLLPAAEFSTPKSRLDPLPPPQAHEAVDRSSPPFSTAPPEQRHPQEPTPRSNSHRSLSRPDEPPRQQPQQQLLSPQNTPRSRKLSKPRNVPDTSAFVHSNGSNVTIPGTPEKIHQHGGHRTIAKPHPQSSISSQKSLNSHSTTNLNLNTFEPVVQVDEDTIRKAGIPLDDDPFARVEGVKMMKPTTPPDSTKEGKGRSTKGSLREKERESDDAGQPQKQEGKAPLTPVSPEEYRKTRKERGGAKSDASPPSTVVDMIVQQQQKGEDAEEPRDPITLMQFLSDPTLLSTLLAFLSFYDWCLLVAVSKEIRILLVRTKELREVVLERYLRTVGYSRWVWDDPDPLSLSLQDLGDYMRGVSTPTHEYSRVAAMHVHSLTIHPNHRDPSLAETVQSLTAATRAYTRVLLRLRAQAEKEASIQQAQPPSAPATPSAPSPINGRGGNGNFSPARPGAGSASRVSSRAPSPTTSSNSHYYHNAAAMNSNVNITSAAAQASSSQTNLTFRSPLFRLRRAPLLRVFVPSPGGDWLSDRSVLECEAECKRAGILHLLRFGDVVWDVAVGDEGNVGRLVWDGSFLIDLDYTYSAIGDLPKYLPTLAFPPSYFHRVIRTGANSSNPIVHIDIKPWGEEIAMNLQLLQDRVRTETPQGAIHNVVRWVHRSSFSIRPPRGPQRYNNHTRGPPPNGRIPIPESNNLFIDPGWYGTIVVETEGTNEALADLQERCGPGAFPPRARGVNGLHVTQTQMENRKVFRILREKSRPGEIWLKAVGAKERIL